MAFWLLGILRPAAGETYYENGEQENYPAFNEYWFQVINF
jgi:hypothetical protein